MIVSPFDAHDDYNRSLLPQGHGRSFFCSGDKPRRLTSLTRYIFLCGMSRQDWLQCLSPCRMNSGSSPSTVQIDKKEKSEWKSSLENHSSASCAMRIPRLSISNCF